MSMPATLPIERRWVPAGALALVVHAAFLTLLVFGVQWQNHPAAPVQAELWTALPPISAPEPTSDPATPAPPDVAPPPPPPPPPPAAEATPVPTPVKPAIVTEKAKPRQDNKPVPDAPSATDKAKQAREEAALRDLDRQLQAQAKRAQAEQQLRQLDQETRLARQQREAEERQKQQTQAAQASAAQGAADRIQAKIQGNTVVPLSVPAGITIVVKFVALPDGSVLDGSIRVVSSSGNLTYDEAVQRAIVASQPLPMPDDILLRRAMRDIRLTIHNVH